jgi:hypothetical protein
MSLRVPPSVIPALLLAALALGGVPSTAEAQFGKRLKDAMKRTAEDKAIQMVTTEDGTGASPAARSEGASSPSAGEGSGTAPAPARTLEPGEGAWANFDFKPGTRVLFADDFTRDEVGD